MFTVHTNVMIRNVVGDVHAQCLCTYDMIVAELGQVIKLARVHKQLESVFRNDKSRYVAPAKAHRTCLAIRLA